MSYTHCLIEGGGTCTCMYYTHCLIEGGVEGFSGDFSFLFGGLGGVWEQVQFHVGVRSLIALPGNLGAEAVMS